jgi:hypothetical protein
MHRTGRKKRTKLTVTKFNERKLTAGNCMIFYPSSQENPADISPVLISFTDTG